MVVGLAGFSLLPLPRARLGEGPVTNHPDGTNDSAPSSLPRQNRLGLAA